MGSDAWSPQPALTPSWFATYCLREYIFDLLLGEVIYVESGLIGGLTGSMGVILCHLAVTKNPICVAARIRTSVCPGFLRDGTGMRTTQPPPSQNWLYFPIQYLVRMQERKKEIIMYDQLGHTSRGVSHCQRCDAKFKCKFLSYPKHLKAGLSTCF